MTLIVGNTRYRVDFSFSLTVTLMVLFCHDDTVLLCLVSSMLHETGHLAFMYIFHQRIESVTFGAFGVRIDRQFSTALSYKKEAVIAVGGICVNLLVAFMGAVYYYLTDSIFSLKFAAVNIVIAIFNSIPIETLDMGRVLRYTLLCFYDETKCRKILYVISVVSVNLLALVCIIYSFCFGVNLSLIAVTVYLYAITLFKKWS